MVAAKAGGVKRFESFDEMLRAARPDTVIVCTKDGAHHEYIVKALEAGCDVISEKPMTIDAPRCREILEAERRTGRKVTVIFNVRSHPFAERVKELVSRGDIGKVIAADFEGSWTRATARTTSGAGTAVSKTAAACSSTRPRTTSTW